MRIEVEDSGIGIRAEDQPRLFVEFQQLDAGTAKKFAGTGLGLALTRRIVEAQGGRVGVRSEPGKGSVFFALLPRDASRAAALASAEWTATPAFMRRPPALAPRVLVVEDDPGSMKLMEATLRELGYRPICASDGEAGLAAARDEPPAAVILDLLMPRMDGFELLERFRASPGGRTTPVVVWSVKELTPEERERIRSMAQGTISKGRAGQSLLAELSAHLGPATSGVAAASGGAGDGKRR
jgi:CheY-like chemotaxis protein